MSFVRRLSAWLWPTANHKRYFITLFLLGLLLSSGPLIGTLFMRATDITSMQQGVATCWHRTSQTLLTVLANHLDSHYVGKEFTATTQECWGEVIATFDGTSLDRDQEMNSYLQQLALQVFNFHQNVQKKVLKTTSITQNTLFLQYQNMEKVYLALLNSLENYTIQVQSEKKRLLWPFYLALGLSIILQMVNFLREKKVHLENSLLEEEAEAETVRAEMVSGVRVEEILKRAFRNNNLWACSQLFNKYHSFLLEETMLRANASQDSRKTPSTDCVLAEWDEEQKKEASKDNESSLNS